MYKMIFMTIILALLTVACKQEPLPKTIQIELPMQVENLLKEKDMSNDVVPVLKNPCLIVTLVSNVQTVSPNDFIKGLKRRDQVFVQVGLHPDGRAIKTYTICHKLKKTVFVDFLQHECTWKHDEYKYRVLSADRSKVTYSVDPITVNPGDYEYKGR
ncbi:hypothetical protein HQ571_01820 [Candidatus Kuenenbacteria bacterium]|nr:hypothetical protein [Candidatus Kuenenbacteria bacterium]